MLGYRARLIGYVAIVIVALAATACSDLLNPFKTTTPTSPTPTTPAAFKITAATTAVDSPAFAGACPKRLTFSGTITSNDAGTITFKWERSDGSATPTETLTFPNATSLTTVNVWEIPATASGWQRLRVVTPNDLTSAAVTFSVTCQ